MQEAADVNQDFGANKNVKTLNLRLEEVAHIRSVLTKAELEAMAIDSAMRDSIARGKVWCLHLGNFATCDLKCLFISFQICFHCMKTKFGIFSRGQKCEMCKQLFCNRCHTRVSKIKYSRKQFFSICKDLDFYATNFLYLFR